MKIYCFALLSMSLLGITSCEQERHSRTDMVVKELPHWSLPAFESQFFRNRYNFDSSINPFYLNLDVDGNGTLDLAAIVIERSSGRKGIAILQHEADSVQIFGAGNRKTLGGANWKWLVGWKAEERLTTGSGQNKNKGTALILYTDTGGSNCMFWNGTEWEWVEQ